MKNKITNTADEPITLATLFTAQPEGIEAQERRGQEELVNASQLPARINSPRLGELKLGSAEELYAKLGIKVIGNSENDSLFLDVQLPENWKLRPTGHAMWSDLQDDRGRKRASIFYKAAFYDRDAHLDLLRRFAISNYEPTDADGALVASESDLHTHFSTFITDSDKPSRLIAVREKENSYEMRDAQRQLAEKWLYEKYPDWKNYFAYWN